MGYKLCVAEKPSVARDIAKVVGATVSKNGYLEGNGYIVTWAVGHLVGLAEPDAYGFVPQAQIYTEKKELAYNELPLIPKDFKLIIIERTRDQFNTIKHLMHRDDVDLVIDCGDMGPEGHILQWFIRKAAGCTKPVMRFCATSLTDEAIRAALGSLRPVSEFDSIIRGQFAKKQADWILGMSLSRAASLKYTAGISVGRVQSPTLYFVVKRFLDIENFKVTDYYTMEADLVEGFKVFWNGEPKETNKGTVESSVASILRTKTGVVSALEVKKKATDRPQLYDITELQRDANVRFGYTAAVTLAVAQSLYETHKVLSYPRTDSRYITTDLEPYMQGRVEAIRSLAKYSGVATSLLKGGLNIDKKIVDDSKVTDHHAIIPTDRVGGFDMAKLYATPSEKAQGVTDEALRNVLSLVLCRFLVAFCKPYIYESTVVAVKFPSGHEFKASGAVPLSMGWKGAQAALLGDEPVDDSPDVGDVSEQMFPGLVIGQQVTVLGCKVVAKKTAPPKLHTEATLLTAMENAGASVEGGKILKGRGIGTQATRAEVIKSLFDKEVVEVFKKGKTGYIRPTAKGLGVVQILPKELCSAEITAQWESSIAAISDGASTEDEFMSSFVDFVREKVYEVKASTADVSFKKEREVFGVCRWCKGSVYRFVKKDGKNVVATTYYCAANCGFRLNTHDKTFDLWLGRSATDAEAKKFIADGKLRVSLKKKSGTGTYPGEFVFVKREVGSKLFCNLELVKKYQKSSSR